jgi:hypothetical protein
MHSLMENVEIVRCNINVPSHILRSSLPTLCPSPIRYCTSHFAQAIFNCLAHNKGFPVGLRSSRMLHRVTSQKSEDPNYTAAEAEISRQSSHLNTSYVTRTDSEGADDNHTAKCEAVPLPKHHDMEAFRRSGVELHTFLTWAVDEGDDQVHPQTCNSLGIITPDIHRIRGRVGPIADRDPAVAKNSYPGHFNESFVTTQLYAP